MSEAEIETEGARILLSVAYDGRGFGGWQSQPDGNTIQDVLLAALQEAFPAVKSVHGSGRTDAGVSADAQTVHFDAPPGKQLKERAWIHALNTRLPRTVRVTGAREVPKSFHARFSATSKRYEYRLLPGEVLPPLDFGLAWRVRDDIDRNLLEGAIALFQGEHDFTAFAAKRGDESDDRLDPVRTISKVELIGDIRNPDGLVAAFEGNGFLYKMVRLMVGAAVQCGEGKLALSEIERRLSDPASLDKPPLCAPADGLRLVSVSYS